MAVKPGHDVAKAMFRLRQPCDNCPFREQGGIALAPGRLRSILEGLIADDHSIFHCHKTAHGPKGGVFDEDDGHYTPSNHEAFCYGALVVLERMRRPSVAQRLGRVLGYYDPQKALSCDVAILDGEQLLREESPRGRLSPAEKSPGEYSAGAARSK